MGSSTDFFKNTFTTNMEGDFDCMTCGEYVENAFIDISTGVITYKCSQNHLSKIEMK